MTNREKLANMALYDMLCRIHDNANKHHTTGAYGCVLVYITGENMIARCAENGECKACIARWLNEEHDE